MSRRRAGFTATEWRCLSGLAHPYSILGIEAGVPKVVIQERVHGDLARKVGHGVGQAAGRLWYGAPAKSEPVQTEPVAGAPAPLSVQATDDAEASKTAAKKAYARARASRKRKVKPVFGTAKVSAPRRFVRGVLKLGAGTPMSLAPSVSIKRKKEEALWHAFLGECQVDEHAFCQLVAEAESGGDPELVDEVLAFERLFSSWVEAIDPDLLKHAGDETVQKARDVASSRGEGDEAVARMLRNTLRIRKRIKGQADPAKFLRTHGVKGEGLERFGIPLNEWNKLAGLSDAYAIDEGGLETAPQHVKAAAGRKAVIKNRWRLLKKQRGPEDILAKYARRAAEKK